jgi:polyisoprenoid-binding protein YceI
MKKVFYFLFLMPFLTMAQNKNNAYLVNNALSKISWTGYGEIGSYSLTGGLKLKKGSFDYDGKNISNGLFVFDMRSITHEESDLVAHLKNEDFFHVSEYPTALFQLKEIKDDIASGVLIIKQRKKEISFPVKITTKENQVIVSGKLSVDRTQFKINYNSSSFFKNLGDNAIKNTFDLSFNLLADKVK